MHQLYLKRNSHKRRAAGLLLILGLLTILFLTSYAAEAGDLDPAFGGGDGIVNIDFGGVGDYGYDMVQQADGKIIIVGKTFNGTNDDFAITRLNPDGTLDTTFGNGGRVTTDFGNSNDVAYGVALQPPNGKIVVVGSSTVGGTSDFAMARYFANGTLDTSLNGTGKVTTDINGGTDIAYDVTIDSETHLIVAGLYHANGNDRGAIVRYTAAGVLDGTFATGGIYKNDSNSNEFLSVIMSSDKIVAISDGFSVWRLNPDGSPDTGFGTNGVSYHGSGAAGYAHDIIEYPGGKYVLVGGNTYFFDMSVIRINNNGTKDTSFAGDGEMNVIFDNATATARSVAIDASGRIVVGGDVQPGGTGTNYELALARVNANGTLDTSFSFDGKVITALSDGIDRINAIALTSDDRIIVAGETVNGIDNDFLAARYYAVQVAPTSTMTLTPSETLDITLTSTPTATATTGPSTELLPNNSFEIDVNNDKIPDGWTGKNLTKDKLVTDKPFKDKFFAYDGEKAFRFKGGPGEASKIQHKVNSSLIGTAGMGDTVELKAWVDTAVAAGKIVTAKIKYTNGSKLKLELNLANPTNGYQQFTAADTLTLNVASIKVIVAYKRTSGKVLVDLVTLKLFEGGALTGSLLPLP